MVECSLAQLFKEPSEDTGTFRGGPARTILHGLGDEYRWLAMLYAVCLLAAFGIGFRAFQGNIVAGAVADSLGVDRMVTGIMLAIATAFIVWGGLHRIAKTSDVIVPIMAVVYIVLALMVVISNLSAIPAPVSQGITQSFSVFIDTFIVCSCTAFIILLGEVYVAGAKGIDGVALTQQSLASHLGEWAQYFLTKEGNR